MAKSDDILVELKDLKDRLYGEEGDMKLIRHHLEKLNGSFLNHERSISKNRIIAIVAVILASGGASAPLWVSKLIGG